MGIPGFSTWLRQRYPEAFEDPKSSRRHDAVYIDLASTLHTVTRKAYSRNAFHMLLHKRLDELIDSLQPQKRVVIAMDGPAPLAKLLEQRRRRKKEADKTYEDDADNAGPIRLSHQHRGRRKESPNRVSSLFLTTGTLFMLEVHNSLMCYIIKRLGDPKYEHLEYEFSDSTVKGEGELKIVSRLIQSDDVDMSHAVVGADSDLLLMTMIAFKPQVFVVDDLPKKKPSKGKKAPRHKKPKIFKSNTLAEIWKKSLLPEDPGRDDVSGLARDLTLLAILSSGNDYLPGCQGLTLKDNSRPGIWNLYLDMRRQPEWMGQNLTRLVPVGDAQGPVLNKHGKLDSLPLPSVQVKLNEAMVAALLSRSLEQKYASIPGDRRKNFSDISGNWTFGLKHLDRKKMQASLDAQPTPQLLMRKPADSAAYIKGIEWTLTMYSTGGIDDYRYSYPAAPPTVTNLVHYLESKSTASNDDKDENEGGVFVSGTKGLSFHEQAALQPLLPAACALALLPARSRNQAASALRHLMDADSPVAEIYAVCKECQRLARSIREANAELEEVRKELGDLQHKLSSVGLDSESAIEADSDLAAALEKWEAAGEPLRDLLRDLSRSHHKHVMESHPYKPFPTEELEEAMLAVPVSKYPYWERQLTKFGREIVYKKTDEASSLNDQHNQKWMKDCLRFAKAYPKVADEEHISEIGKTIGRHVVPLHPYMQPGGPMRLPPKRAFSTSTPAAPMGGIDRVPFVQHSIVQRSTNASPSMLLRSRGMQSCERMRARIASGPRQHLLLSCAAVIAQRISFFKRIA
ncbi:hypothetical protein M9434_005677 [Picochlorum sp. BPE23]|nr:hypothetical protein M9434_005677 [Picochlorum sp. BPE23]